MLLMRMDLGLDLGLDELEKPTLIAGETCVITKNAPGKLRKDGTFKPAKMYLDELAHRYVVVDPVKRTFRDEADIFARVCTSPSKLTGHVLCDIRGVVDHTTFRGTEHVFVMRNGTWVNLNGRKAVVIDEISVCRKH